MSMSRLWQNVAPKPHLSGRFVRCQSFESQFLPESREIMVYLPPSYGQSEQRYPVMYMHDGNNLFDPQTAAFQVEWNVDEHLERLIQTRSLPELIVVGIYNTRERNQEYTWLPRACEEGFDDGFEGGDGPRYARFLVEELKPAIDAHFATRPEREATGVSGSSLGGLISFYLGLYYPDVFSKIGMLSPSVWWQHEQLLYSARQLSQDLTLWVDMGSQESTLEHVRVFVDRLRRQGFSDGLNLLYTEAEGAAHNEAAWAQRVDDMLCFLFA